MGVLKWVFPAICFTSLAGCLAHHPAGAFQRSNRLEPPAISTQTDLELRVETVRLEPFTRVIRPSLNIELELHAGRVLRAHLRDLGWRVGGKAHIVPVHCGDAAMAVSRHLLERGVYAPGIRYPTVAAGSERIRLTVSAAHTDEHLLRIAEAFGPRDLAPGSG